MSCPSLWGTSWSSWMYFMYYLDHLGRSGKGVLYSGDSLPVFVMGLAAGIIGVAFHLNDMRLNDIPRSFDHGAADLLGSGSLCRYGAGDHYYSGWYRSVSGNCFNTILHTLSDGMKNFPPVISAWFMYLFQSVFNFFVVSGSGQAALTMPIMAPLADLVGVERQVAVVAFQLGAMPLRILLFRHRAVCWGAPCRSQAEMGPVGEISDPFSGVACSLRFCSCGFLVCLQVCHKTGKESGYGAFDHYCSGIGFSQAVQCIYPQSCTGN